MTAIPLEVLFPQVNPKWLSSILVRWQLEFHQVIGWMWDSSRCVQFHKYFFLSHQIYDCLNYCLSWIQGRRWSHAAGSLLTCTLSHFIGVSHKVKMTSLVVDHSQLCGKKLRTAHWPSATAKQPAQLYINMKTIICTRLDWLQYSPLIKLWSLWMPAKQGTAFVS